MLTRIPLYIFLLLLAVFAWAEGAPTARLAVPVSPALDARIDAKTVPVRLEGGNSPWEQNTGWPRVTDKGVFAIEGPGGPAMQFSTGYAIYDGIAPAGTGTHWTASFWLRPDEPDWGVWQVPWNSKRDPQTMYRFAHPTVMHLGTFLSHLWEIHLCRNHLEVQVGDWTAWSTAELSVGRWTHVAIVRDGDALRLYLDGKTEALLPPEGLDGATGKILGFPPAATLPSLATTKVQFHPSDGAIHTGVFSVLVLGNTHDGPGYQNKFIGAIGSLVLENRAWSAEEIAQQATAARKQADTLAKHYSVLDDPAGGYSRRPDKANETAEQYRRRMAWFHQAKYGLLMHWNPSSVTGTEISWGRGTGPGQTPPEIYDNLYKQFNPTKFDPHVWAKEAKAGGMRYAVLTVKHHDGFLMWASKTSTRNITATPYHQDIAAQYVQAMRAGGVRVGLYYSPRDWWWQAGRAELTGAPEQKTSLVAYISAHLRELCTNYGPLDDLWFDGGIGGEPEMFRTIIGPLQPACITNDRNGPGDYFTPEGHIPIRPLLNPDGSDALWESCIPMGNGGWSYHDDSVRDYNELIHEMVEIAAKGGNMLRDIGPQPNGEWSPSVRARIKQLGAWLKINGESIYSSHRTRLGALPGNCWATANRTTLYLHLFAWPENHQLHLAHLPDRALDAHLLATGKSLRFSQKNELLTIDLPEKMPDLADTVIAVRVKRK